jgi:large subunit ribosomal protein L30
MIAIIRISGMVKVPKEVQETLYRIHLRKKYAATLLNPSPEVTKLLYKIRNYVAYGPIDKKTLLNLIKSRAQPIDKSKKIDPEKVVEQLDKKSLKSLGLKPFFRLHPPRKGIESKKHFGVRKGVLGDNKEKINELIGRML